MKVGRIQSIALTAALWGYFIGAFLAAYWLVFLVAGILRGRRGISWALRSYARGFIAVMMLALPRARLDVPERPRLRHTRGSVVVCNHLSFLDPLLLLSLLPGTITIVRPDFFRVPVFGWLLRGAGFLGPDLFSEGRAWIDRVARHLRAGGNLLIFPEGTRSRAGRLAPFKKGAFYLARAGRPHRRVTPRRNQPRLCPRPPDLRHRHPPAHHDPPSGRNPRRRGCPVDHPRVGNSRARDV